MAANSFDVVSWVSMETLRLLVNKLQVAQFFNNDHEKEFQKEYAVGASVTVKYPRRFISRRNTLAYDPQALSNRSTTITVDQIIGVDFEWDSVEAALKMERGRDKIRKDILEPAAAQIAQDIDSACALYAKNHTPNIVGVLGTAPTTLKDISGRARQRLIELACPAGGEKGMIVAPSVMTDLAALTTGFFNPSSEISKAYKEGSLGKQGGFDWYESMSLYTHTAGTWAGAVTVSGAGQSGTSLLVNCTIGDTFKEGDVINIAAVNAVNPSTRRSIGSLKQYTLAADVTATATTATLTLRGMGIIGPGSPYQTVDALPANTAALTLFPGTATPNGKSGVNGLAIHSNAFSLVGVKLEVPKAVELSSQAQDPDSGLAVRFIRQFDAKESKMINRFDCLFGFGDLYPDNCAVRILSN